MLTTEQIVAHWNKHQDVRSLGRFVEAEVRKQDEAEARRDALEEAAKKCEAMHEEDRPGDYAYAIRALKESPPPTA